MKKMVCMNKREIIIIKPTEERSLKWVLLEVGNSNKSEEKHKERHLAQETKCCNFCCMGNRAWNSKVERRS